MWAAGVATGAAKLFFPSARSANDFLHSFRSGKIDLPANATVQLVGQQKGARFPPDQWSFLPTFPPLRTLTTSNSKTAQVYDEDAIATMLPSEILRHRYVARIVSGVSTIMDEASLLELFSCHGCIAAEIGRHPNPQKKEEYGQLKEQLKALLVGFCSAQNHTMDMRGACGCLDEESLQASLRVGFSDLNTMAQVYAQVRQCRDFPRPYGQPCQVGLTYTLRVSMAADVVAHFEVKITQIWVQARGDGVVCSRSSFCGYGSFAAYQCQSTSTEALDKVAKAVEEVFECDAFMHPILDTLVSTEASRLEVFQSIQSCFVGSAHVRYKQGSRVAWVCGAQSARRVALEAIQNVCLELDAKQPQPVNTQLRNRLCHACEEVSRTAAAIVEMTVCHHTVCLPCVRRQLISVRGGPLRCHVASCKSHLHVKDVVKFSLDIPALLRAALFDYTVTQPDDAAAGLHPRRRRRIGNGA